MTSGAPLLNPFTEQTAGKYFVGREEQLRQFERALAGLREGIPRHLYVAGVHGTGKTSYLAKLVDLSRKSDLIGVMPTLDPTAPTKQHIETILKSIVSGVDDKLAKNSGYLANALRRDWDAGAGSTHFRVPKNERLESDDLRHDFEFLLTTAVGVQGIVVCVDECQRIDPFAMSALKNALQGLTGYLIVISLRLVHDSPSANEEGRRILDEKAKDAEGDFGASRFYVAGVPLGPFSSEDESRQCVTKRLHGNPIEFDEQVVREIGRITGRLPSAIVALASDIYDATADSAQTKADMMTLHVSFRRRHSDYYTAATDLCGNLSRGAKAGLDALLAIGRPATADELSAHMYPGLPPDAMAALSAGVAGDLDRACRSSLCTKKDGKYEIADSYARYALELALEAG